MKRIVVIFLLFALAFGLYFLLSRGGNAPTGPQAACERQGGTFDAETGRCLLPMNAPSDLTSRLPQLVATAQVVVPDTQTTVTLKDGAAEFNGPAGAGVVANGDQFVLVTSGEAPQVVGTMAVSYGGSGTFHYAVLWRYDEAQSQLVMQDALLLGDRIAVDDVKLGDGKVEVAMRTRKEGEPLAATPTVAVSKYFSIRDGRLLEIEQKNDLIRVESPEPGAAVASPLVVRGEARGMWYFEATFPVVLTDWDGRIIAEHYAEAQGEWMTENFVPFEARLSFPAQESGSRGFLILKKSNPSGLPENDDAIEVPVFFQ